MKSKLKLIILCTNLEVVTKQIDKHTAVNVMRIFRNINTIKTKFRSAHPP